MNIPRIIHQIWLQGADCVPPRYVESMRTWQSHHRGWTHRLWDERALHAAMREHAPEWCSIYDAQEELYARADVARYFLLQHFGGLYADIDTRCLRPVDPLLGGAARLCFTFREQFGPRPGNAFAGATNSVIASTPAHPFWLRAFDHLERHHGPDLFLVYRTGPQMLNGLIAAYDRDSPGDVQLIRRPAAWTGARAPRWYMRVVARLRGDVYLLDFNDSARRNAPRTVARWLRKRILRSAAI